MKDQLFLTLNEAREAVRLDLEAYGPQPSLYAAMLPLLDVAGEGSARRPPPERKSILDLLARRPLQDGELEAVCSLVFDARVRLGEKGGRPGLWVETGMENYACTRCGQCCLALDFHKECTAEDVARWKRDGRQDILAWVGREAGPDGEVGYRIWRYPGTPLYTETCPWLRRVPGDKAFVCAIQDAKPEVCRSYPGTAKHARMTGCPGLGRS